MFEGETTIKFSKQAGMLMMSQNMSDLFKMPLEVTAMDMTYSGLEVTFGPPEDKVTEPDEQPAVAPRGPDEPHYENEPEETPVEEVVNNEI